MTTAKLNKENFQEFISSGERVVVDFFAEWCAPCKAMNPIFEQVGNSFPGRIGKIDVEENPEITSAYGIRNIPTVIVFKDGIAIDKIVGTADAKSVEALLSEN